MENNNFPDDPQNPVDPGFSDRTLSAGGTGGAAAGQIGPYRLLRALGEGGMGEVWLAEQKQPIKRTVALKVIKAGMDTKTVVARFEAERQALALMDHPNIAHVYDAGSTAEGRPYFVMEYVPGLPITEYCDKHMLTMKERLELLMQVCDGVQHAHQKAIIHRDLKPSNVLVVEQDEKAVPKIIDFGLAKATAQRLTDKTMFTELGVMLGTPEYMSPEQADQREQNIDTRTDVYSLGVILYELLVGVLPFEAKVLRAAGLDAILRIIREEEPPKPSTKIRSMGDGSAQAAEKRGEEPRSFARHVQGELDWITMKALEKDRTRRYSTPSELSADISRYLRSEPVLAGPATTSYRIRKYATRHRVVLGIAAGLLLLTIAFVITQTVELHRIKLERDRATRERVRATRERDRADRITQFMTQMFKVSDPSEKRGNSITAREILDKASADIDTGLTKDPGLQAQMMQIMAEVYDNLGLYPRARVLQQQSTDILRHLLGPEHSDTIRSMTQLASFLEEEGNWIEAEKLLREALDIRRRVLGPEHPDTIDSMNNLLDNLHGQERYPEAEKLARQILDIQRRVLGSDALGTRNAMTRLADMLELEGQHVEAEKLDRQVLDIARRVLGPENPETLGSMHDLGMELSSEGKNDERDKLFREIIDIKRRVLGPENPDTILEMGNLAVVLEVESQYAEAEKLDREVLDIRRRVLGPEHPDTLTSMDSLASLLVEEGQYAEAEKIFRATFDIRRRVLGPESPDTIISMNNLARDLLRERKNAEADKLIRETLNIQNRVPGPESLFITFSTYQLGCSAALMGRRDEALSLLREAVEHGLPPDEYLNFKNNKSLSSLHGDPRLSALVAQAKERAAAAQKTN